LRTNGGVRMFQISVRRQATIPC